METNNTNMFRIDRFVAKFIALILGFIAIIVVLRIFYPEISNVILQTIWYITVGGVGLFTLLGALLVIGKRKEVNKVLDLILEGSLTFVDIITFLRELRAQAIKWVKNLIIAAAPVFSYAAAFLIYTVLILFYKWFGKSYDVTFMTAGLTFLLVLVLGLLNKPSATLQSTNFSWTYQLKKELRASFMDGMEVVVFIFFLTMERTDLFFIPESLRVPLEARVGEYDLIHTGYTKDGFHTTLTLLAVAVGSEVIRIISKILVIARRYYDDSSVPDSELPVKTRLKNAIRSSYQDSRREVLKFIAFNTLLLIVFLAFPRLKVLSLAVASFTGLLLDLLIPGRMVFLESKDLLNRIFAKVVRI